MNKHHWRVDKETFRTMVKDATFTWSEFTKVVGFITTVILSCILASVLLTMLAMASGTPDYTGHPQRGSLTDIPSMTSDQEFWSDVDPTPELGVPVARPLTECQIENKRTGRHVQCPIN